MSMISPFSQNVNIHPAVDRHFVCRCMHVSTNKTLLSVDVVDVIIEDSTFKRSSLNNRQFEVMIDSEEVNKLTISIS